MHNLIIDGKSLKDFGIYVSGENSYNAPAWAVETEPVPGRHGELLQLMDRMEPISVSYPAFIRTMFPAYSAQARLYLLGRPGWRRIEDDYHPESFRRGYFAGPMDFDTRFLNLSAELELVFTCQPQRWIKSGETPVGVTTMRSSAISSCVWARCWRRSATARIPRPRSRRTSVPTAGSMALPSTSTRAKNKRGGVQQWLLLNLWIAACPKSRHA